MSATLIARSLAAGHGERALFAGLDLVVAPGDVVGLVGANGAGKSTLLAILAGLQRPEDGTVELSPRSANVGHLPQEPERRAGESIRSFLERRTGVGPAQTAMEAAASALASGATGAESAYGDALERWLALGGADLDERAEAAVGELGLAISLDAQMTALSGGQAARASLASLLLSRYDVFLLDEPTNDLDLDGLERLERFVERVRAGTVLVSHDREFLARTVTRVVELDLAQRQVNVYGGGYEAYLAEREVKRRHAREAYEGYADTRSALEERARTQRTWMEKGVRNARRKATDNDKIGRKHRAESTEQQAAKAKQTERRIERLQVVEAPRREWELRMEIAAAPRAGDRRGPPRPRDRAARRVHAGAGLAARRVGRPDRDHGRQRIGQVDPARARCSAGSRSPPAARGSGRASSSARSTRPERASSVSGRCSRPSRPRCQTCCPPTCAPCSPSSGSSPTTSCGPPSRSPPASAPVRGSRCCRPAGVNLLILDEPTNHLDLPAIEQLEGALDSYEGTLLLVTHDRRMLEAVQTNRHLDVEVGQVRER